MAIMRRQPTWTPQRSVGLSNFGPAGNLFQDLDRFMSEFSTPLFEGQAWSGYPVDLYETGDNLVLEMGVPGIRIDDLDISIEGRQLSIRGQYLELAEGEERRYWVQSIPHGEFSRTLTLPVEVDVDSVQAHVHDGVLVLTMPKVAEARAKKITVNAG